MQITPNKSLVRWLVVLEILLGNVFLFIVEMAESQTSQLFENTEKLNQMELLFTLIMVILAVTAYIGVFRFKPWGRGWYLLYHVLNLASIFLPKPEHIPLLKAITYVAVYIVIGTVLYLLYFTKLKEYFIKKSLPGFVSRLIDVSKFGFWKSALAVYVILSLSCWASYRFDLKVLEELPFLGLAVILQLPLSFLFMYAIVPGNFLTNLGILANPNMLKDHRLMIGFWLVLIFLNGLALFIGPGKKKWFSLGLLLLFMMLALYNCDTYAPHSM